VGDRHGPWIWFAASTLHPVTRILARRHYEGLDNIPHTGGVLVVFNHISYLDPIYDGVFVHRAHRRVPRFLAKDTLWQVPLVRNVLSSGEQIPVRRGSARARSSVEGATEALRAGKLVAIYPEGTVTRDPEFWPMRARTGVARMALDTGVPVIPVAQWGAQSVYDHYAGRFRPLPRRDVVVRAGSPVDLTPFRGRPIDHVVLREVTDHVMGAIRDLLAELRGEPAPTRFAPPPGRPGSPAQTEVGGAGTDGPGTGEPWDEPVSPARPEAS
jgi:1-acyl-sn-glycerol-3-phosphate acyltransferase